MNCDWCRLLSAPYASAKSPASRRESSSTSRNPLHVLPSSSEIAACIALRFVKTSSHTPSAPLTSGRGVALDHMQSSLPSDSLPIFGMTHVP